MTVSGLRDVRVCVKVMGECLRDLRRGGVMGSGLRDVRVCAEVMVACMRDSGDTEG